MAEIKRLTAVHTRISTIHNSEYVKQEGWDPNYLLTEKGAKISRINVLAIVVSDPTDNQIEVDDGSAKIVIRQFEDKLRFSNLKIGTPVLIIGKPRQYERVMYILPEIVKKLENPEWLKVRANSCPSPALQTPAGPIEEKPIEQKPHEAQTFRESYESIYALIRNLDDGRGADIEEVLQSANQKNGEDIIKQLIIEGEVFELQPGKLKILE